MVESYTSLLEKTRVPQPSLQKFAVNSIFSKLRSAPKHLDPESEPGREAISQCLRSLSPAVVDQSVRELCRLVVDSKLDLSRGFLELQSALEGTDSKFIGLFVKGLGFLTRVEFERNHGSWRFGSTENHPFVKILLCRNEVQSELVQQVLLFMARSRRLGMVEVCEFLRPFLNFSILQIPFSDSLSSLFARDLISSMASFCCSFPSEAIPVFKLLMDCLKYIPHKNSDELRNSYYFLQCVVDAYAVVLRHLVGVGLLVSEAQLLGVELSETVLSLLTCPPGKPSGSEPIIELIKRLFIVQKDLALQYIPKLSSAVLSLFIVLIQSQLEHEQISLLKVLIFLLRWKSENEYTVNRTKCALNEELLLTFPAISLLSSASRSVKGAAADLLLILEKLLIQLLTAPRTEISTEGRFPSISSPGSIIYRLLHHLWFQYQFSQHISYFENFASRGKNDVDTMHNEPVAWASQLREYSLWIVDRRKSSLPISHAQQMFLTEMSPLLSAVAAILLMHQPLGNIATDLLAAIGIMDPKQGVPLLLVILFFSNIFSRKDINYQNMLPKLLATLPSLASHYMMAPLIIQTILPMLQKDSKPVWYTTGARLLCQTWANNDRAFGSLQKILLPKGFIEFKSERNICISLAASIRDVCRKNPDRGVDLILSVSACIESRDPIIQALGFQSLAHLCETDVIDFYTAWDVIAKHVLDYSADPVLAQSLCLLLRWGAMDAEAYEEGSRNVLKILWGVATSMHINHAVQWAKSRVSAFEALIQYEVPQIQKGIPNFRRENLDLFLSETDLDVLGAMEVFQVKIIQHEHVTRRRLVKEKKVAVSKIEKLLDVFPQVLFPSGKKVNAGQLPGAALLCLNLSPKDVKNQGILRASLDIHAAYENALAEIAASLQLSRNIYVALLSLQSWKPFMRHWMRANMLFLDAKTPSTVLDKTSKAANDILKSVMRLAEESIPRSAENIALAIGALCVVLPPSAHTVKSAASKFLLNWLFQYEHEHHQWSAAISLGLITSCLHVTDHKQKFQNINGLIEVIYSSKSILVKGACGIGLGFSCQDLLTRVEVVDNIDLDKETYKMQELQLLGKIVRTLLSMVSQLTQESYNILDDLSAYFPVATNDMENNMTSNLLLENCDDLVEDIWGVAGIVLGFGSTIGAIYRAGAHDAVLKIKNLIISWIPQVDSLVMNYSFSNGELEMEKVLLVGSCLAVPTVVAFCQRVEMMNDNELDHVVSAITDLISELTSVKKSSTLYQSLLMASCVGAGNLLACILNEGVHPIEVDHVKRLLELFRKCYSNPYPHIIHLGGMLGVVNAMGAGAGILVHGHHFSPSIKTGYEHKDYSSVLGPLLSNPTCEPYLTSLVQEIFLVAQNSDDLQLQQNAAWAVSFLRNLLWSKEVLNANNVMRTNVNDAKTASHSFSEETLVLKLSIWLMNLNYTGTGTTAHVSTVATVLRCLSQAPRLPSVDWGSIIRRCMRYEAQVSTTCSSLKCETLREGCVKFSIVHATQFDSLLTFLDELSDLSRFRTLELNLQSCILKNLTCLVKIFSDSRLEKLLHDVVEFFSSESSYLANNPDQKSLLRVSTWKGLYQGLDEASINTLEYRSNVEKCMELLFSLLPASEFDAGGGGENRVNSMQEWNEAVNCLAKVQGDWLLGFLQVPPIDLVQEDNLCHEIQKKIITRAKLVRIGSIPLSELGKLKAYILNFNSHVVGTWNMLVEVVAALQHADGSVKRQWLNDVIEISCVSGCPSTALQFLGLLCGSNCRYMALLTLDRQTVLSDLPVTLNSLLTEPNWEVVAESVVSNLWVSTERIYHWVTGQLDMPSTHPIDESENDEAVFLLRVMHHACVSLKHYLPLEKQLRLANMVVN